MFLLIESTQQLVTINLQRIIYVQRFRILFMSLLKIKMYRYFKPTKTGLCLLFILLKINVLIAQDTIMASNLDVKMSAEENYNLGVKHVLDEN